MPDYGKRTDGTPKGRGYFGELNRPDGKVSTELSIGVGLDGKETEIPLLVPTLAREEIEHLLSGGEPSRETVQKAVDFATNRLREGKSPFAADGEQGPLPASSEEYFERGFNGINAAPVKNPNPVKLTPSVGVRG